jgi:apolipoprotein N-acyltransferase
VSTRAHLLLLAGAALYALALPPIDLEAGAWLALVPLIALAGAALPRRAAWYGVVAGFYTAWAVTWWLPQAIAAYFGESLLVGAASISVAYVLAVSTTFGVFAWVVASARAMRPLLRLLALAAAWTALELVRARVLEDPWALLGYTQYRQIGLIQIASLSGVYGLSFLVVLGNATIALLLARPGWRVALGGCAPVVAVVAAVWTGGTLAVPRASRAAAPYRVAIVQPDVTPAHTWTRGYSEHQLASTLALTRRLERGAVDLVVWPENSVTLYPEHEPFVRRTLESVARHLDADLVVGAPRDEGSGVTNSARLVRPDGAWYHYDKQRLVPFAEAPIGFDHPAARSDPSPRHFRAGTRPGLLPATTPLGVSICHELLYPETIHPAVAAGATVLVNIANDGWLDGGYGVASRQHFAMGVLRAVEARRYLVRAATRGVSGVVDPWGRILVATQPADAGVTTAAVVPRVGLTPYVRFGDWFPVLCAGFAMLALGGRLAPLRRRRTGRDRLPVPQAV